jgi:hypothetical protein
LCIVSRYGDALHVYSTLLHQQGLKCRFFSIVAAGLEIEATSGPAVTAQVNFLFALQEVSDQGRAFNNSARYRAEFMLDWLEEIRTGLLLGPIRRSQLYELARSHADQRKLCRSGS